MSKRIYLDKIDARAVVERVGGDPARIRELARKAGLDPALLEKWIAGKTRLSAGDKQKIAKALG